MTNSFILTTILVTALSVHAHEVCPAADLLTGTKTSEELEIRIGDKQLHFTKLPFSETAKTALLTTELPEMADALHELNQKPGLGETEAELKKLALQNFLLVYKPGKKESVALYEKLLFEATQKLQLENPATAAPASPTGLMLKIAQILDREAQDKSARVGAFMVYTAMMAGVDYANMTSVANFDDVFNQDWMNIRRTAKGAGWDYHFTHKYYYRLMYNFSMAKLDKYLRS
jgi:hypothetical protein